MALFKATSFLNPFRNTLNRLTTSAAVSTKLSIEEKLGIQPKPKRPKSTFLRFLFQIKPQLVADNPKASITELNRLAGERWRSIDIKEKLKLQEDYQKDWLKYLEEMKIYESNLSPGDKEEIRKATEGIVQLKKKKQIKEKMSEMGRPKKPPSTYVRFFQSKLKERGETPYKEFVQHIKKDWEAIPESVKNGLQDNYRRDLEKYKTELFMWERRMENEGHKELVRRSQRN